MSSSSPITRHESIHSPPQSKLARLQQVIALFLISCALGWTWWAWERSWGLALAGVLFVVFGYGLVLALEFVAVGFLSREDSLIAARPLELVRAWWLEVRVAPLVFLYRQPFTWRRLPDSTADREMGLEDQQRRSVVFVHGFFCNRGFWQPWMAQLRKRGLQYTSVNLEPVFGPIDDYIPIVDAAIARAHDLTGLPPLVVCHSMGGLALRAWADAQSDARARIFRVVTIGSPHHGTWLGRFSTVANGRQMRENNPWLLGLAEHEQLSSSDPYKHFVCWYSNGDNIVFPASTAKLPGADNRHLPGISHVALAFHPKVMAESLAMLASAANSPDHLTASYSGVKSGALNSNS